MLQVWRTEDGCDCGVTGGVAAPATVGSFPRSKSSAVECSPPVKGLSLKFVSPMLPSVIALTGFSPVGPECSCVHI